MVGAEVQRVDPRRAQQRRERQRLVREVAGRDRQAKSVAEACHNAAQILAANPLDLPFAAIELAGDRVASIGADKEAQQCFRNAYGP